MTMNGTVLRIHEKGFGFLKGENGVEYFFHRSEVVNVSISDLQQGDPVEFEVDKPKIGKGPRARQVVLK